MFHISNDKRAVESAKEIRAALGNILRKQPFDLISISDLCREAKVSRTTFYRLFDNTSDIIRWDCDREVRELCLRYRTSEVADKEWPFRFNLRHILENPGPLELACKAGRVDIADAAFLRHMTELLEPMRVQQGVSEEDLRLSGVIASGIITSAFSVWVEGGKRATPDEFYQSVMRVLQHLR